MSSIAARFRHCCSTVWFVLAVLSFMIGGIREGHAAIISGTASGTIGGSIIEFRVRMRSTVGSERVYFGILAVADSGERRLCIYWREPACAYLDALDRFVPCDLILANERLDSWFSGRGIRHDLRMSHDLKAAPIPFAMLEAYGSETFESRFSMMLHPLRVSLAPPTPSGEQWDGLWCPQFFRTNGAMWETGLCVLPAVRSVLVTKANQPTPSAELVGAFPPFGRQYSRKITDEGNVLWQIRKVLVDEEVLAVETRIRGERELPTNTFDTSSLGKWEAVPLGYSRYWEISRRYRLAKQGTDCSKAIVDALVIDVRSLSSMEHLPDELHRAILILQLRLAATAMEIGEADKSIDDLIKGQKGDQDVATVILAVGRAGEDLKAAGCTRTEVIEFLDRATEQMAVAGLVQHPGSVEHLITQLISQRWTDCAKSLARTLLANGVIDGKYFKQVEERVDAETRPSGGGNRSALLTAPPVRGDITASQITDVLRDSFAASPQTAKLRDVGLFPEEIVKSLSMVAGERPYKGNAESLKADLRAYLDTQFGGDISKEDIPSRITGLLLLHFYCNSTPEDATKLDTQIRSVLQREQSFAAEEMLRRQLLSKDQCNTVAAAAFASSERELTELIGSIFWPMFKYPLSEGELRQFEGKLGEYRDLFVTEMKRIEDRRKTNGIVPSGKQLEVECHRYAKRIVPRVLSVRMPPDVAGIGFERMGDQPLRLTWRTPFPENPEQAKVLLKKLAYFYGAQEPQPSPDDQQ